MSSVENGYIVLHTGAHMPIIGLGTWKSKPEQVESSVQCAISEGYRHIDCAIGYDNEKEVGTGIAAKIADGTVKREDLFVTSKLDPSCNEPEKVEEGCKESLQNLGLDYLDLYLIHWPIPMKVKEGILLEHCGRDVNYTETWKAMEELIGKGYCKAIGVSNFNKKQIEEVLSICKHKPAVNQIEVHPYLNNSKLINYCKSQGIHITAYSPFASPDQGRPTMKADDPKPLEDPVIKEISLKHKVTPGHVILKWLNQLDLITIPKSITPERIRSNIQIKQLTLTAEEMEKINGLNIPFRACDFELIMKSKYYPFNDEY